MPGKQIRFSRDLSFPRYRAISLLLGLYLLNNWIVTANKPVTLSRRSRYIVPTDALEGVVTERRSILDSRRQFGRSVPSRFHKKPPCERRVTLPRERRGHDSDDPASPVSTTLRTQDRTDRSADRRRAKRYTRIDARVGGSLPEIAGSRGTRPALPRFQVDKSAELFSPCRLPSHRCIFI